MIGWVLGLAWAGTPRASSEATDSEGVRAARLAFDGLLSTGWAEGVSGPGAGEWIELAMDRATDVTSVSIWPGNLEKGERSLREYGRPHTVTVVLKVEGGEEVIAVARVLDRGPQRVDVPIQGKATAVRVKLDEAVEGGLHSDTCIAEIAVNFADGEPHAAVTQVLGWLESTAGVAALEQERERVTGLYDRIKAEEFGDRDALMSIMDSAGDGAPYLRKKVEASVPAGFRVAALRPDPSAIDALLRIKDSNAIPALERAALRSTGKEEKRLWQQVEVFNAYQELIGGPSHNVPPFGQSGWERGALRSHGEPLDVVVDGFGGVHVADTGNNRVQRFSFDGISEAVWGSKEPDITNAWFQKGRTWYASGSRPGEESGQLTNPVSLALLPDRAGDQVVVLDALGRLQILMPDGSAKAITKVSAEFPISPGAGGEGHVMVQGGKVVTIWSNEGWVHTLDGKETAHFELQDGAPTCAVMFSSGRFGLCYQDQLVEYDTDGYRHGDVMNGALGEGFEAWDAAFDNRGKLWVATDDGWLYKFKRPGKVDYRVRFSAHSVEHPRLGVYDEMAFISFADHIAKVDALELHAAAP